MGEKGRYWIMDGRAHFNMDCATVCEVCDTLAEARKCVTTWPTDHVIVDSKTMRIVY